MNNYTSLPELSYKNSLFNKKKSLNNLKNDTWFLKHVNFLRCECMFAAKCTINSFSALSLIKAL